MGRLRSHPLIPAGGFAVASFLLVMAMPAAEAGDKPLAGGKDCVRESGAIATGGALVTDVTEDCPEEKDTQETSGHITSNQESEECQEKIESLDLPDGTDFQCGFDVYPTSEDEPQITPGLIQHAMQSFEIPAPDLVIQPPDGKTLVNFETNFFTEADIIHRSTTLLGQDIDFRIFPDSYTWRFGDGEAVTTPSPGAPYPDLDVTHKYLKKGTYQPSLETTYTADYRVNGGAWQPVPGTLVLADEPQLLEAVTARPILVAPDGKTTS